MARAARSLAERFAPQLAEVAELAGLLHDNAKEMSGRELIAAAERFDIEITPGERSMPNLLHGKVGAVLLSERFDVGDARVAAAVADHVTGRVGMGQLSLILFVADQIAEDREFKGIDELRRLATEDLEEAALTVAANKLKYVIGKGRSIEPQTMAVHNELLARVKSHAG